MWLCCLYTVGQVVHTLAEGRPVQGVTSLADKIYVLRDGERHQVEVYDVNTYRLQRRLTVPNSSGFADMTSCEHRRCIYISDDSSPYIHKLNKHGATTRWDVYDQPWGLSVNSAHHLIATCPPVCKIKEFNTNGKIIREIQLPDHVVNPWHAIQLSTGHFVVCYGGEGDLVHNVCMVSADGRHIVHSHRGIPGSVAHHYDAPAYLALNDNECVFVADAINRQVMFLSPQLNFVNQFVSRNELKGHPLSLSFDVHRQRLYVADNEWEEESLEYLAGRVVVLDVCTRL